MRENGICINCTLFNHVADNDDESEKVNFLIKLHMINNIILEYELV